MERAARLIQKNKYSRELLTDDELMKAIWPAAVGKAIAAHTSSARLVRTTLIVEVEDAIWQKQLHGLSLQIVNRLRKIIGTGCIEDVEFRIAVPRRRPQRAESIDSSSAQRDASEDAEAIEDPILRKLYKMSRKRTAAG
ncbi:MAG: DUF721 domain-containing protein [Acidobacteriaceae bacterium]|nr:DUF721 domain-containing protein [Acidobacteriaceae bacterium]